MIDRVDNLIGRSCITSALFNQWQWSLECVSEADDSPIPNKYTLWALRNVILFSSKNLTNQIS